MAKNIISLEDFKKAIRKHRSVIVTYDSTGNHSYDYQLRYDMDYQGCIREVVTYTKHVYFAARIDGDDERLAKNLYLETAKAITPTPAKDLKRIDCRCYEHI